MFRVQQGKRPTGRVFQRNPIPRTDPLLLAFRDRRGDWGRDVTLWAARRLGGNTLAELAREVGAVDYTAIYQGVRRLETRSKKDDKLLRVMRPYERKLASMYNVET